MIILVNNDIIDLFIFNAHCKDGNGSEMREQRRAEKKNRKQRILACVLALLLLAGMPGFAVYGDSGQTAVFAVGQERFSDLNAAVRRAQALGISVVSVAESGTLPAGNYTIPAGITLLVPFDEAGTVYTEPGGDRAPEAVNAYSRPEAFRTLSLESGAVIDVENGGTVCVPSKYSARQPNAGAPTGAYGLMKLAPGSSVRLQNGAKLFAYGYISGSGDVRALQGSTVWECFQIRGFRGGNATLTIYMDAAERKLYPFSQYYVQNIEANLTVDQGAVENVTTAIYAGDEITVGAFSFIGEDGLLQLRDSGTVTKSMDDATGRCELDLSGTVDLESIRLTVAGVTINSGRFVLPVPGAYGIHVRPGATLNLKKDCSFLPGTEVQVDAGAILGIASEAAVFVYDQTEWEKGSYAGNSNEKIVPVSYNTTGNYFKTLRDARFDLNGTLAVQGKLYTTKSGADITSTAGTGRVSLLSAADPAGSLSRRLYEAEQNSTNVTYRSISLTPAQLHNGSEYAGTSSEYTVTAGTAAGREFCWNAAANRWELQPVAYTVTVEQAAHGAVLTDRASAYAGDTVTLTVSAENRYALLELKILDAAGNALNGRTLSDGRYQFTMPDGNVRISASFDETDCPGRAYTDVDVSSWYHDAVDYALEHGLMQGTGNGMFAPDSDLTRAMLVQILYNMEAAPEVQRSGVFTDVADGAWYAKAVNWAAEKHVVEGVGDGLFQPDVKVTREQMALIIWRYLSGKDYDTTQTASLDSFRDRDKVSSWAQSGVQWAVGAKVIQGKGEGLLDPGGFATRAQIAQVFKNLAAAYPV